MLIKNLLFLQNENIHCMNFKQRFGDIDKSDVFFDKVNPMVD